MEKYYPITLYQFLQKFENNSQKASQNSKIQIVLAFFEEESKYAQDRFWTLEEWAEIVSHSFSTKPSRKLVLKVMGFLQEIVKQNWKAELDVEE